jgi:hypothetical protein
MHKSTSTDANQSAFDPKRHQQLRLLPCNLTSEPHFAGRKSLL